MVQLSVIALPLPLYLHITLCLTLYSPSLRILESPHFPSDQTPERAEHSSGQGSSDHPGVHRCPPLLGDLTPALRSISPSVNLHPPSSLQIKRLEEQNLAVDKAVQIIQEYIVQHSAPVGGAHPPHPGGIPPPHGPPPMYGGPPPTWLPPR